MKIFRAELEEIIGVLVGAVFWYSLTFVIITMNFRISIPNQIITWVNAGLLVFFIIAGHYIVSSEAIDEKKRIEDRIDLKSNLIGYFLGLSRRIPIKVYEGLKTPSDSSLTFYPEIITDELKTEGKKFFLIDGLMK